MYSINQFTFEGVESLRRRHRNSEVYARTHIPTAHGTSDEEFISTAGHSRCDKVKSTLQNLKEFK